MACPRCGGENSGGSETCQQCGYTTADSLHIRGRYRMTKPYIFSSFRAVYQAVDVEDENRIVSVREFLPTKVNPGEVLMVRSQFEALMNQYKHLKHRNLAGIVDYFVQGNYYYVIYEYVNGLDITKYLNPHKLLRGTGYPEELVSHWTLQLSDLFEYFHHSFNSPVHLIDFKPHAVVFRQEDEELVYIDNGLSKLLAILGPHYLITEDYNAFKKSGGKFDSVQWDLFCLGNFMYYLLTGIDLLRTSDMTQVPLRALRPDISDTLAAIVEKAVGNNYKSDYEDIRELRTDLFTGTNRLPLKAYYFYSDFVKDSPEISSPQWEMLLGSKARTNAVGLPPRTPVKLRWVTKIKPSAQYFLSVSENYVYATSREGSVYAADSETGEIHWHFPMRRKLTAPGIAYKSNLYYITPNRELLAIRHGEQNYTWTLDYESSSMSSPVIYEGILFIPLYNGTIYAVGAEKGNILTSYKIEGNLISSPIIHENIMYMTSLNKHMCAIQIEEEETIWQYESDTGFSASPSLAQDILFVGSFNGAVTAVNRENGGIMWYRNFKGSIIQSVRATPEHVFFITQGGDLYGLNAKTGETIWKRNLGVSEFEYPFCMSLNSIFIVDPSRHLLTIDTFSGESKHSLSLSHPPVSQMIIAHGQIYLVSSTGHLVCFGK